MNLYSLCVFAALREIIKAIADSHQGNQKLGKIEFPNSRTVLLTALAT
jgi:hypothetical protein